MKKTILPFTILAAGLMLAGCTDRYADPTERWIACLKEINKTLAGVKDKASAEAATPKLETLRRQAQDIAAELRKLGPPSKDKEEAMKARYSKDMSVVSRELGLHLNRLRAVEGGAKVIECLSRVAAKGAPPKS